MPQLLVVGRVLAFIILGYFALIFTLQRRMAFPGTLRDSPRPIASAPRGVTQVWLEASFGPIEAWFFRAEGDVPRPTIIFCTRQRRVDRGLAERYGEPRSSRAQRAPCGVSGLRSLSRQAGPPRPCARPSHSRSIGWSRETTSTPIASLHTAGRWAVVWREISL